MPDGTVWAGDPSVAEDAASQKPFRDLLWRALIFAPLAYAVALPAHAHGVAGNRYFPATLVIDDPAVDDELTIPDFSATTYPVGTGDTVHDTSYGLELERLLTPDLAFQIDSGWTRWTRPHQPTQDGFDTTSLGLKARVYENDPHETLVALGLYWGIPNSGSSAVGAGRPGSIQPEVTFGKGFGDLPDSWSWLRPFAIAGTAVADLPTHRDSTALSLDRETNQLVAGPTTDPSMLQWGFALEYSTLYLTNRFTGSPPKEEPLNQLVPLVEFAFDTPLSSGGQSAASVNPGLSYVKDVWQIGAEAAIPLDSNAGKGVGVRIQFVLFIDDAMPSLFGKPLLSEHPLFGHASSSSAD